MATAIHRFLSRVKHKNTKQVSQAPAPPTVIVTVKIQERHIGDLDEKQRGPKELIISRRMNMKSRKGSSSIWKYRFKIKTNQTKPNSVYPLPPPRNNNHHKKKKNTTNHTKNPKSTNKTPQKCHAPKKRKQGETRKNEPQIRQDVTNRKY